MTETLFGLFIDYALHEWLDDVGKPIYYDSVNGNGIVNYINNLNL